MASLAIEPPSVGQFFETHADALGLELVAGKTGLDRIIREPTVNRPGLALAGFYNYFAPKRIQVFDAGLCPDYTSQLHITMDSPHLNLAKCYAGLRKRRCERCAQKSHHKVPPTLRLT